MDKLFEETTFECSKVITNYYSTSFSMGIKTLDKKFHKPVYGIYGFVRYADEIVDTFHQHDKEALLGKFKNETYHAIENKISFNPVLHAFQSVVHQYKIENELVDAFLHSMEMDLYFNTYDHNNYEKYIYGSAEVVGLMCLKVFCEGNDQLYHDLKEPARRLGAAFQKVNFLRDIKDDYAERGRIYFPYLDIEQVSANYLEKIINNIQEDFDEAFKGIKRLPKGSLLGVYLAYIYYLNLFNKIKKASLPVLLSQRIRIPNFNKYMLLMKSYFAYRFNLL